MSYKARLWMVAAASAAATTVSAAIVPFPGFNSVDIDPPLILRELNLHRSQFGFPEEESAEFEKLTFATREKIQKVVSIRTVAQLRRFLAPYAAEATGKEVLRYGPVVGVAIASSMSYRATYYALDKLLRAVEDLALSVLMGPMRRLQRNLKLIKIIDFYPLKLFSHFVMRIRFYEFSLFCEQ